MFMKLAQSLEVRFGQLMLNIDTILQVVLDKQIEQRNETKIMAKLYIRSSARLYNVKARL